MAGLTQHESSVLLARAIVEAFDGKEGPGMAHARYLVSQDDSGNLRDPYRLRDPEPQPTAFNGKPLTNRVLDCGPEELPPQERHIEPGTREWFDLVEQFEREERERSSGGLLTKLRGK